MKKYDVVIPSNYKDLFSISQYETIKAIKKSPDFMDTVECMISTLVGNRELLKAHLHFTSVCVGGFYDNHIDIFCDCWIYDSLENEVVRQECYFSDINEITGYDSRRFCGYVDTFKKAK